MNDSTQIPIGGEEVIRQLIIDRIKGISGLWPNTSDAMLIAVIETIKRIPLPPMYDKPERAGLVQAMRVIEKQITLIESENLSVGYIEDYLAGLNRALKLVKDKYNE